MGKFSGGIRMLTLFVVKRIGCIKVIHGMNKMKNRFGFFMLRCSEAIFIYILEMLIFFDISID